MKIDFCSDTHWDFYVPHDSSINFRKIEKVIDETFGTPNANTLVIAGDTGHYPKQDVLFLSILKERYKNIFIVLGNHNLYCVSKKQTELYRTWQNKFNETKKLFEDVGCHVLDGDTVKLEDKTIGGAMGWYDGSYFFDKGHFNPYGESLESRWKRVMNDSRLIPGLKSFYDIFTIEIQKVKRVFEKEPDLIVTHYIPSISEQAFFERYRGDANNAFYSFQFDAELLGCSKNMKWIYGHTHDRHRFTVGNIECICNPFGYPGENSTKGVKTLEI